MHHLGSNGLEFYEIQMDLLWSLILSDAKQKKHIFLMKNQFLKKIVKKKLVLMFIFYFLQFEERKIYFKTF